MTDHKNVPKRGDDDFETHSRVEIDGAFTIPTGAQEKTARLPKQRKELDPDKTLVSGAEGGGASPATPVARTAAMPHSATGPRAGARAGKVLGDRFEVMHPIGEGGMGEVFLVRDRQIENREVALKLVRARLSADPRYREMFFKEIRSAQGFVSEHAVQIRDCGELPDGNLFLTMDFVEGESLTALLKREKSLMPRHALEIARQVLLGLSSGHEKGFVHRDVKPSNVMLAARVAKTSENPHGVKVGLLDFGIAGLTQDFEAGRGPGTPHYMSPEQAAGDPLDTRSDLFAVGVMLFEMISGERPFEGRTLQEITTSVIETDPIPLVDRLDGIKKPIKKVLRKALQKKREKRYSSAADFIAAIESCTAFKQTEGAPRWVAGVAGLMTLATVGLAWQNFDLTSRTRDRSLDQRLDAGELRDEIESEVRLGLVAELVVPLQENVKDLRTQRDARQQSYDREVALRTEDLRTIERLESELKAAEAMSGRSTAARNTAVSQANAERFTQETVITLLKDHIEDLVTFSSSAFGQRGANLCAIGEAFDHLTASVVDGSIDDQSRIIASAIEISGVDANAPGVPYLARIEELAKDVHAFEASASVGDESFGALADLRTVFDALSSEDDRRTFEMVSSSLDESGASRRMWLGLKRLDDEELAEYLVQRGRAQGEVVSAENGGEVGQVEASAKAGLTEAEQQQALEEAKDDVASSNPVQRKEALSRFLRLHTPAYVADALYGAQLDAATRERRLEALEAAFAALRVRLDAQHERLLAAAGQRIARIEAETDTAAKTADVLRFLKEFRSYSGPYAEPLIDALVEDYRRTLITDGAMRLAGVQALPHALDSLVAHLFAAGDLGYEISPETRTDLLWIAGAKHWYLGGAQEGDGAWFEDFADAELGRPIASYTEPWQRLLAFQYQLKADCDLMSTRESARLFAAYSADASPAKQTDWQLLRIVTEGDGLVLEERFYELDGKLQSNGKKPPLALDSPSKSSKAMEWKGKLLLRLTEIPEVVTFVEWEPTLTEARGLFERSDARVFSEMNRNTNLTMLAGEFPLLCLEVTDSRGSSYLVHPKLGVVHQARKRHDYELVHLDL